MKVVRTRLVLNHRLSDGGNHQLSYSSLIQSAKRNCNETQPFFLDEGKTRISKMRRSYSERGLHM